MQLDRESVHTCLAAEPRPLTAETVRNPPEKRLYGIEGDDQRVQGLPAHRDVLEADDAAQANRRLTLCPDFVRNY